MVLKILKDILNTAFKYSIIDPEAIWIIFPARIYPQLANVNGKLQFGQFNTNINKC